MKKNLIISLDIGGTNTRCALVSPDYKVQKVLINPTVTGDTASFLKSVKDIIIELTGDPSEYLGIAIGVPGRVRNDGYIDALPNIHISKIPLSSYLYNEFKLPVYVKNDAEVAALAEAVAGPYKKYPSLYFITISTGVGGALTIGGKLRNSSYEVGHTLFTLHGETHEFEHMASGSYLVRLAAMNNVEIKDARQFFDLVKKKDPQVLPIYQDWISLFSSFINMNQQNFEPAVFALTGGVMKSADIFFEDLKKACPRSILLPCHYEQEAGLVGAAVYGYQMLA